MLWAVRQILTTIQGLRVQKGPHPQKLNSHLCLKCNTIQVAESRASQEVLKQDNPFVSSYNGVSWVLRHGINNISDVQTFHSNENYQKIYAWVSIRFKSSENRHLEFICSAISCSYVLNKNKVFLYLCIVLSLWL